MESDKFKKISRLLGKQYEHILDDEDLDNITYEQIIEKIINYYENIINCIPGNFYWFDKNCKTVGCSKDVLNMFGFKSPKEFRGLTFEEMGKLAHWDKDAEQSFKRDTLEVITTGQAKINIEEPSIPHVDGRELCFLTSRVPLFDEKNNVIGAVGVSVDISERKQMEIELREAKENAEAANKAKSEFLAAVSHELRIPLTGILGMARLLIDDDMLDMQRKQVKDIIMSGEHLLALVDDLLDLAKFEAGKLELNPGPLDFRKLIEEISTMLTFQAASKNLELLTEYADDAPHMLIGDSRALRQILLNLMGNAVKFTERGHVKIHVYSTEREQLRAKLVIIVEDTGIGIPAEKKNSVFERFNQVDSSRTRRYGGAGLGLTITKAYVELMGGKITVESEVGKGTQFICKIPFVLQDMVHRPSAWEQYKSWVRVLIVDDTQRGEVLSKHLDSPTVKLTRGEEGFNALMSAHHQKEHFHVVIIDQQLQSTDAMALGRKIKSQRGLIQPMMVLLMPPSTLPAKESAKSSGFYEILTKPVHPTELYVTLTAAWEKWEDSHRTKNKVIPAFAQHQPQVLLVEDDPIIQKVHTMMLERVGCKIGVASNGDEALKMYNQGYDAILMDVGLPGMSGIEIAAEIRKREAGNGRIPIIGVTGYGYEEDKRNCLAAGMDDVAIKPLKPDELTQILIKWVAGASHSANI